MSLPGGPELLIILAVLVLMFGATKLPKLARSMGQSAKEFKQGLKEGGEVEEPIEGPCPFCDTQVAADARFCQGCGRPGDEIAAARKDQRKIA
jgi:sec-independent protein translocase protein TatA